MSVDSLGFPEFPAPLLNSGYICNPESTWQWVNSMEIMSVTLTEPFFIVLKGNGNMAIAGDLGHEEGGIYTGNSYSYVYSGSQQSWLWVDQMRHGTVNLYGGVVWRGYLDYCIRALIQ